MKQAHRFSGGGLAYEGLTRLTSNGPVWTGKVVLAEDKLAEPLRWKVAKRVFVNSMSDLFHEALSFDQITAVYGVMATSLHHTYQVLTKRPERRKEWTDWLAERGGLGPYIRGECRHLRNYFDNEYSTRTEVIDGRVYRSSKDAWAMVFNAAACIGKGLPLPNVWEGVSVEDQKTADERIPWLLRTPAAVRWVSYEPALGPIDFDHLFLKKTTDLGPDVTMSALRGWHGGSDEGRTKLDWIVVGGESGPGARPMHPDWARSVRDHCIAAEVKFFFKQWGQYRPASTEESTLPEGWPNVKYQGSPLHVFSEPGDQPDTVVASVGKKQAGRLLDGREWNEFPQVSS